MIATTITKSCDIEYENKIPTHIIDHQIFPSLIKQDCDVKHLNVTVVSHEKERMGVGFNYIPATKTLNVAVPLHPHEIKAKQLIRTALILSRMEMVFRFLKEYYGVTPPELKIGDSVTPAPGQ